MGGEKANLGIPGGTIPCMKYIEPYPHPTAEKSTRSEEIQQIPTRVRCFQNTARMVMHSKPLDLRGYLHVTVTRSTCAETQHILFCVTAFQFFRKPSIMGHFVTYAVPSGQQISKIRRRHNSAMQMSGRRKWRICLHRDASIQYPEHFMRRCFV